MCLTKSPQEAGIQTSGWPLVGHSEESTNGPTVKTTSAAVSFDDSGLVDGVPRFPAREKRGLGLPVHKSAQTWNPWN